LDIVEHVALHERGRKKVCLDVDQHAMDEIGSYVACIRLPMAEIWYQRFVRGSEEATICPCGLFFFPNQVPLSWPSHGPPGFVSCYSCEEAVRKHV
jgi:hypothetical protein